MLELINKLLAYERHFSHSHGDKIDLAKSLFLENKHDECRDVLNTFPSQEVLLGQLTEKLKGKSVYKTLKLIAEGKCESKAAEMKGLFSLGTHIAIECEKENSEYGLLLPYVYEKLGQLIFNKEID